MSEELSKAQHKIVTALKEDASAVICYTPHRVYLRWKDGGFNPTQTISRATFHVLQARGIIQKYGGGLSGTPDVYKLSRVVSP
jgi:hypothetical protein